MSDVSNAIGEIVSHTSFSSERELSFADWIERWNKGPNLQEALSLLHVLFETRDPSIQLAEIQIKKLLFLIRFCDGHNRLDEKGFGQQEVQNKAFKLLSDKFFAFTRIEEIEHLDRKIVEALFVFFRSAGLGGSTLNVSWSQNGLSHHEKQASDYLRKFCGHFWSYPKHWAGDEGRDQDRIAILEILYAVEGLDSFFVERHLIYNGFNNFTAAVVAKIEELMHRDAAKRSSGFVSAEELVLWGSPAARLFIIVTTALKAMR